MYYSYSAAQWLLVFYLYCMLGWCFESTVVSVGQRRLVNRGFLRGPMLPIYGFGLCTLFLLASMEDLHLIADPVWNRVALFLAMAVAMTLIEYIAGLACLKYLKVRLWDYSNLWGNIQGIICPLFSFFWTVIAAVYYLFVHKWIVIAGEWIGSNPLFSFFVGMYLGVMLVDVCYSFHIVTKLRKWAAEHKSTVTLEKLKLSMKVRADKLKQKIGFLLPFRGKNDLTEDIEHYKNEGNKAA